MKERVVVGMSGGVDSSVAAYLLIQQGYDVVGVTMQIWQDMEETRKEDNGSCCSSSAVQDARKVADALGIPYYVMNFKDVFKDRVMNYFVDAYLHGKTPNPCIVCNRYVKWEALLNRSKEIGATYVATGHYARVIKLDNGRYTLKRSKTVEKDQTYALYNLTQEQLSHTIMPLGEYSKSEVRSVASKIGLQVASKPDSQEICFIPDNDYASFIDREAGEAVPPKGNFVTVDGEVIGEHKGITHYTIGQRKGLNLALGHPVFVVEIRPDTNEVVIGDNEDVFTDSLVCEKLNYMSIERLEEPKRVLAKIRYSHRGSYCKIEPIGEDTVKCTFEEPVRAVTPGQAVVFYEEDHVLGGGIIK